MIDYNQLAAEYARHRQVHPGVVRDLLDTGGVGRDSKMLEIGCGTGNYIVALQSLAGASCWAIDPSEEMLTTAATRVATVRFGLGNAECLKFPPEHFDLVFSVDVIHHVKDRQSYFHETHRVLRKGGRVCTVTDSEWIIRNRRPLTTYFPETADADLLRYPRIARLRELMAGAGFHDISEHLVEFPYELSDLGPYIDKAFSALHLILEEAFQKGLQRMQGDLIAGPIPCVARYVLLWGAK